MSMFVLALELAQTQISCSQNRNHHAGHFHVQMHDAEWQQRLEQTPKRNPQHVQSQLATGSSNFLSSAKQQIYFKPCEIR